MNNLTEQEAFNVADFINSYLFTAIKQDGMDDMEWLSIMVSAYKKLSAYSDYNNPYANETEEENPWLKVYWNLMGNPLFMGEYDAENGNERFMSGVETVMEYIAEKAGKAEAFRSIFYDNIEKSLRKAGRI